MSIRDWRRLRQRGNGFWLTAALLGLALVQIVMIGLGDSRFYSSTDAGGRAASIGAAVDSRGCDHDLGYWAASADPDGGHHPMVHSTAKAGRFVQPASIGFVCAASASAGLFGQPFALVVPVAGVLMAAVGAWMLDRTSGGSGWLALALVGLGPVAFYGADVWEHAPATGAAVLGTALLFDPRWTVPRASFGGILWGAAITLRVETAVVAVALAVVILATRMFRRRFLGAPAATVAFAVGVLAAVGLDRLVERTVLGADVRGTRAVGGDGSGGQVSQLGSDVEQRLRDVAVTTFGLLSNDQSLVALLIGAAVVAALFVLALGVIGRVRWSLIHVAAGAIVAIGLTGRTVDLGFVPGLFVAGPVAVVGVVAILRTADAAPTTRAVAIAALFALPGVWLTQWTGAHEGQWGGRYQLTSAVLLTIAGSSLLGRHLGNALARVLIAVAVVVGLLGLTWHAERSNRYSETFAALRDVPCDGVLVSASIFLLREGGALPDVQDQRIGDCWLLSAAPPAVGSALSVAEEMGESEALVVYQQAALDPDPADYGGWRIMSAVSERLGALDVTLVRVAPG